MLLSNITSARQFDQILPKPPSKYLIRVFKCYQLTPTTIATCSIHRFYLPTTPN